VPPTGKVTHPRLRLEPPVYPAGGVASATPPCDNERQTDKLAKAPMIEAARHSLSGVPEMMGTRSPQK